MKAKQFRAMTAAGREAYRSACAARQNFAALNELDLFEKLLDRPVRVIKGRKVPVGTEGVVFWVGAVNYSKYCNWWSWEFRVGFKDDSGEVYFTNEENVELV